MNIILFGLKGTGKTTLGSKLAKQVDRAFFDTDHLIEEIYQVSSQRKLTYGEIYRIVGPMGFKALEFEAIQSLQDVQHSVIAVGGGAMTLVENVEILSRMGHLVHLIVPREELKKRILESETPPAYFDPKDPGASFDRMYEERFEFFEKIPALQLETAGKSEEELLKTLSRLIEKETDGK